jgi:DNA-binding NarL/FixJ family response regulator
MIHPETIRWSSPLVEIRPFKRERGRPWGSKGKHKPFLTRRMKQAVGLISLGLSNREIAAQLRIEYRTVTSLVERTMRRLGVHSRLEVALRCWKVAA